MVFALRQVAWVTLIFAAVSAFGLMGNDPSPDLAVLGRCSMKFLLCQHVAEQANVVAHDARQEDVAQVQRAALDGSVEKTVGIRKELNAQFGDNARLRFEPFVADYTTAEKSGDAQFLSTLGQSFGILPAPADYASFRKAVIDSFSSVGHGGWSQVAWRNSDVDRCSQES